MDYTRPWPATATALIDAGELRRALNLLLPQGQVTELRALDAAVSGDRWPSTLTGYFDDAEKLIAAVSTIRAAKGIYVTPNPVDPALIARAANRIRKTGKGESTSDRDIVSRRWLLVDCDAQRPAGISATDAEHQAALDRAREIADELHYNCGWPEPIAADSGNGGHLMYRIDEPANDGGLVERCLKALADKFTDAAVKIDTSVHNPARIWKLYGTLACKGDSTEDRPHRMSRVLSVPSRLISVSHEHLIELAGEPTNAAPKHETNGHAKNGHHANGAAFDVAGFIARHGFDVAGPDDYQGGRRWTFNQSPMCSHHSDGPFLIQFANGALAAGCHHESCSWDWRDLRAKYEPAPNNPSRPAREETKPNAERFVFRDLAEQYPRLHPPVVHGLFRRGEVVNLVSHSKAGKSWLAYSLALSVITGRDWLSSFATVAGKVLLVDNELHRPTIAARIPRVADALGIGEADYARALEVMPLRGNMRSLIELGGDLPADEFSLIILDAKYRFASPGASENDNAAETATYNLLDDYAARTNAAILVVHHASKGAQGEKRVTDVGAGAGAQSRAADCHLILREHEEPDVSVFAGATRSFPPTDPFCVAWDFPLWRPVPAADPEKLKGKQTAAEQRQSERDRAGMDTIRWAIPGLDPPVTASKLRQATAITHQRIERLLAQMVLAGQLTTTQNTVRGNACHEYHLPK